MKNNFNLYSQYYDLLNRDKDYKSEAFYINNILKGYGLSKLKILEFGSGTGKHAEELVQFRHNVTGVEKSERMIEKSVQLEGFSLIHEDIRRVNLGKKFDVVLSLFHVVSYQISNKDVSDVFSSARNHLNPGGLFIFDCWYTPAVYKNYPTNRSRVVENDKLKIYRFAEPTIISDKNIVNVSYKIFVEDLTLKTIDMFEELHPMRHFSMPEIEIFANLHKFEVIGAEEFLTGCPLGVDTWGSMFTLRAYE